MIQPRSHHVTQPSPFPFDVRTHLVEPENHLFSEAVSSFNIRERKMGWVQLPAYDQSARVRMGTRAPIKPPKTPPAMVSADGPWHLAMLVGAGTSVRGPLREPRRP
jgi:hypothetical protein